MIVVIGKMKYKSSWDLSHVVIMTDGRHPNHVRDLEDPGRCWSHEEAKAI